MNFNFWEEGGTGSLAHVLGKKKTNMLQSFKDGAGREQDNFGIDNFYIEFEPLKWWKMNLKTLNISFIFLKNKKYSIWKLLVGSYFEVNNSDFIESY